MPSTEYSNLLIEIQRLDAVYLPLAPSDPAQYPTDEEQEKVRAYLVFCHAAIEEYLEARVTSVIDLSLAAFLNQTCAMVPRPALALLSHCVPVKQQDPPVRRDKHAEPVVETFHKAAMRHRREIRQNHGIKRTNLEALLEPIGVQVQRFDDAWLSTVDSFGATRGLAAHTGGPSFFSARRGLHPDAARREVTDVLEGFPPQAMGLRHIDSLLSGLFSIP